MLSPRLATAEKGLGITTESVPHITPTDKDDLVLAQGMHYQVLLSWGDRINNRGDRFGFNNDYTALIPVKDSINDLLLWVNHEYLGNSYFDTPRVPDKKTREHVNKEMKELGGSIVRIKQTDSGWEMAFDNEYNRRIDATTPISLVSDRPILGKSEAIGTFANCGGGVTPWYTILSCEENYDYFYGEVAYQLGRRRQLHYGGMGWYRYFNYPPEHYGWVVEVDPFTGKAKKLTSLGRFAHESAKVIQADDGRCVVYMGDDRGDECIYKFIAAELGSLEHGTLYVADTRRGQWLALDREQDSILHSTFSDQTDLLIRTREAARIVGGTPQDRPEDIEVDPQTGAVYIALTKSIRHPYGSILKIIERDKDPLSSEFSASTFLPGGDENGFACPDNLVFDPRGNLWIATDISTRRLNKFPYKRFKNNGLFYIPMSGRYAGQTFQVASAPVDAELTGPSFSADGRTLFLSIQHPGETSKDNNNLSSHWPDGEEALPKPSVVAISGEFIDQYCSI